MHLRFRNWSPFYTRPPILQMLNNFKSNFKYLDEIVVNDCLKSRARGHHQMLFPPCLRCSARLLLQLPSVALLVLCLQFCL